MTARLLPEAHDLHHALQRLNDSLQVLVLLLPTAELESDSRLLLVNAAARQALEDAATFRACFLRRDS